MDVADPAADFQHRCTVEVIRTGEVHDATRRGRQSMTAILTRELAGESSVELLLVHVWRARTAALIHGSSIPRAPAAATASRRNRRGRAVTAREQRRRPVSMASRGEMAMSFGAAAGTYDLGRPEYPGRVLRVDAAARPLRRTSGARRRRWHRQAHARGGETWRRGRSNRRTRGCPNPRRASDATVTRASPWH